MKPKILIALVVLSLGLIPSSSHAVIHYDIFKIEVTQAAHDGNQYAPLPITPENPKEEIVLDAIWSEMRFKNHTIYKYIIKWEANRTSPDRPYVHKGETYYDCKWRCYVKIYAIKNDNL